MLRDNLKTIQSNWFIENDLIPLGINTYRGNVEDKQHIVRIQNKKNGSLAVISNTGHGKSVLVRRIMEYKIGNYAKIKKPSLIIDTQGKDHRLMSYKNDKPHPLFTSYGESAFAFDDVNIFTPIFAKYKALHRDIIFGFSLLDLEDKDYLSSGMSIQSKNKIMELKQSKKNRVIMEDPETFYTEFDNLPSKGESDSVSALEYDRQENINYAIKQSLSTYFSSWKEIKMGEDERPDYISKKRWKIKQKAPYFVKYKSKQHIPIFEKYWDKNQIVLVNYMDMKEQEMAMRLYGGLNLKDAYEYASIKKDELGKNFKGIFVFVEESNLFIDAYDTELSKGSNFYMVELLCRGFKNEVDFVGSFQSIANTHKRIASYLTSGAGALLIGGLIREDRDYLSRIFPEIKTIKLRKNEELPPKLQWGASEWIVYYNENEYDTFVPYPCRSMFHKRGET